MVASIENRNGNGNGTEKTKSKTKAVPTETVPIVTSIPMASVPTIATTQEQATALVKQIRTATYKHFKVQIPTRNERLKKKLWHAAKDKLGREVARLVAKNGGKMDWKTWNEKLVPALLGSPDEMKISPEVLAIAMAKIYDTFSTNPEEAIAELVEYNESSFTARNSIKEPVVNEEIIVDLDDEDDLDDDEIDADLPY